jgi:hypothetical protein
VPLSKEEKEELKFLREYERGLIQGDIQPRGLTPGNVLEQILNPPGQAWMEPGQSGDILEKGADVAKQLVRPKTVGSIAVSEAGGRAGRAIGEKIGSVVPGGPIVKTVATKGLGFAGEVGGRVWGAYAGGVGGQAAEDIVRERGLPEDLDAWYKDLHETGKEEAVGEAISVPFGLVVPGLSKLKRTPASADAKALTQYQHDRFKRSYDLWTAAPPPRSVVPPGSLEPGMARQVIETGGLTLAEKSNSRVLDLLQGTAAGSWIGGGHMRKYGETREKLFHLTAERMGIDIGDQLDPADLARIIRGGEERKALGALGKGRTGVLDQLALDEKVGITLANTLEQQAKTYRINVKNLKARKPGFEFVTQWDGSDISVRQYRQVRDQLQKTVRNPKIAPEIRNEARRLTTQWDKSAKRSLPAGAVKTLEDLQAVETGIHNEYIKDGFIKGLLSRPDVSRSFVNSLTSKPDYINVLSVMNKVDDTTKDNIRRAVVNRTLNTAMLPSGRLSGEAFRKNVEENIGWKALREIVGPKGAKEIDRFVKSLEHIESMYGRGEAARVMTSMTQGTMFIRTAQAVGTVAASTAGYMGDQLGPGLGIGAVFLLGPWAAAQMLTSPMAARYVRFAKAAAKPKANKAFLAREFRALGGTIMDNHIVERLLGRGLEQWGSDPGDTEIQKYLEGKAAGGDPKPQLAEPMRGAPPGQAFVQGPTE